MLDRWVEGGLLQTLADEGIGCIAFSPLAQGILTERYLASAIPPDSRAARGAFLKSADITPGKLAAVRRLKELADARGQTLPQLALTWVLRHAGMTSVLIGASRPAQIDDALGAATGVPLTAEELATVEAALRLAQQQA
jgi:L-glyceraldehyde 3-phosphate reductase